MHQKLQMSRMSNSLPADFSVGGKTFPACKQGLCLYYHSSYRHTRKWFISLKPQRILGPLVSVPIPSSAAEGGGTFIAET